METSLRFGGDDKQLRLHAKENFLLDSAFCLQVHGNLNTRTGAVACIAQLKRKFLPELLTSLDVGARFDSEQREFTYDVRGKRSLPLTDNGLLSLDVKGGFNFNPRLKVGKGRGAVELSYKIFNFTEEQDVKLKVGYDPFKQVRLVAPNGFTSPLQKPYLQIRENNWTLNADFNGSWNIIYDL